MTRTLRDRCILQNSIIKGILRSKMGLQTKKVLSKSTLKEPITFQRMPSSIIVEVALFELKVLTCQFLNGGCKPIVYYTHNGKNNHTLLLNIIFICLVL